jgi:hypothetical protein
MDEQIARRLAELRAEFESGQRLLGEMVHREASLRESMLRISGAILVLEELSGDDALAESPEPVLTGA